MLEHGLVTQLLIRWKAGDQQALDDLIPVVYEELRFLATRQLRRDRGQSIQCTELVAEAYLRLIDVDQCDWQDRNHFFSMAARLMRRVLVDQFRRKGAQKRGQHAPLLTYQDESHQGPDQAVDLDALEDALKSLEQLHGRQAEVVTLKFFAGMNNEEIAQVLSVSNKTVSRDWSVARLWLFQSMQNQPVKNN